MTNEEIKKAKKLYRKLKQENEIVLNRKLELERLKKNKDVIRYLELSKYEYEGFLTENEIIDNSFFFSGYCTEENKNIYVYRGSYNPRELTYELIPCTELENKENYYNIYTNIETGRDKYIRKNDVVEFVNNNIVIMIDVDNIKKINKKFYDKLYYLIKREYYKLLIELSQEKVVEIMKDKTYSLKKRKFY